jgi:Lrp/AsnC family leucine-responsive transcriptional regulator
MMVDSVDANTLDAVDLRLLGLLQDDASRSNQALAEAAHVSPATALRRVRRLVEAGIIERQVAIVAPAKVGGLSVIAEITLDRQGAEHVGLRGPRGGRGRGAAVLPRLARAGLVLVLWLPDMAAYHALVQRLFTQDANVRNVKAFFSVKRGKFDLRLPLPAA